MPRAGQVSKRKIAQDPLYQSVLVAKLVNNIMKDGKKALARKIVYRAFDKIQKETHRDPPSVFEEAIKVISPKAEVRPRRVGGATYMVPREVKMERKQILAIKWLVEAAQARPAKDYLDGKLVMAEKLAAEILDAAAGLGGAVAQKVQVEKQAEANKAFAHFRW